MLRREDTVARLMAEALAGQLPRPAVLRRAAALDLCDPLVGALLAAHSRTSRAPAHPAAPIATPTGASTRRAVPASTAASPTRPRLS